MKKLLLVILLSFFPFFIQAKSCFTINDISVRLDDKSTSDGDFSKFKIYHNDKVLFFYDSRNSRIESEEYKIDTSKTLLDKLNDKFMK